MNKVFIALLSMSLFYSCGTTKNQSKTQTETVESTSNTATESKPTETAKPKEEKIIGRPIYRASRTILTDIEHTQLKVNFNWAASQMNGVATITCSPHFYTTDSLILDAQSMEILDVKLNGKPLGYKYTDAKKLRIGLDKAYTRDDQYKVVIKYIAKPEEKLVEGSSAISSDKGLFFINPQNKGGGEMPQIWTQGETQSNSVWFPTIDSPNQKTTQEIYMTVDNKYKTLSNGLLISSKENNDGTRTDYWKQDLPHAPYLVMMAVGEFSIIKDSYTKSDGTVIPVNYYVEPEWKDDAKAIFGRTPEMMDFFSELLGVEYPWAKYDQIVVRQYVSGAMENTTATVFGDFVYKTEQELLDSDDDATIAHELFHHWFGDLVTLESWSNLPLNESFANYSQYLWDEHYWGEDEADYNAQKEAEGYFRSAAQKGYHPMIWYAYENQEDMFDATAYNRGGRVLHMLRTYLGDDAFFASLKLYLTRFAYKTAEIADLRQAFEEVSGEDLNWFFNEWFFASRFPILDISQEVGDGTVTIKIKQTQDLDKAPLYKLPMKIGVYANGMKMTHKVVVDKNINTFTFQFDGELQNIIVDEDRVILGKFQHKKPREYYVHQYYHGPKFKDREEALIYGSRLRKPVAEQMILDALEDNFWYIRKLAISKLSKVSSERAPEVYEQLTFMAECDVDSKVRAAAASALGSNYFKGKYENQTREILKDIINRDPSYAAVSSALKGLTNGTQNDLNDALSFAKKLENERSSSLTSELISMYTKYGDTSNLDFMANAITRGDISGYYLIGSVMSFASFLKDQDVAVQQKYFSVFESLSQKGGAYINAILPITVVGIKKNAEEMVAELKSELNRVKADENAGNKADIQRKLNAAQDFSERVSALAQKLGR